MSALLLTLRVVLSLVCVLGLIWYAQRRLGGVAGRRRPTGPELSVVGRQSLGRHTGVAVLAAGDRRLLLGVSDQGVTLLAELAPATVETTEVEVAPGSETVAGPAAPVSAAARLLARLPVQREEIDLASFGVAAPELPPQELAPELASQAALQAAVGSLDGSILAPSTWRKAARAVQLRAVRQ